MRPLVVATTTIVLFCMAMASSAAAAAPGPFYGVVTAEDPSEAEFARMGAGKVGTLRINLVWGAVQSGPGAPYDWGRYDTLIGRAAQNGIRVFPTVYSSPLWAAATPEHPPLAHLSEFEAFVRAAVQRYGTNGDFWTANPQLPKVPITDWQCWNESNSPSFWRPKPNAKQYVALLRAFNAGVDGAADPGARVVLGGLFRTPRVRSGIFLERYLPALYRRGARPLFDAAAVHPYARRPKGALKAVKDTRKIMGRFKDRRKPVWLTEVGWATGGKRTLLTVDLNRQANYLRRTFELTAANRNRLKIAGVTWFSLKDLPGEIWFNHTGLFTTAGAAKPSWNALVGLTGGTP